MSKYTLEFKLKVVKYYIKEHHGFRKTASKIKIIISKFSLKK